jgi:hypothetical protein
VPVIHPVSNRCSGRIRRASRRGLSGRRLLAHDASRVSLECRPCREFACAIRVHAEAVPATLGSVTDGGYRVGDDYMPMIFDRRARFLAEADLPSADLAVQLDRTRVVPAGRPSPTSRSRRLQRRAVEDDVESRALRGDRAADPRSLRHLVTTCGATRRQARKADARARLTREPPGAALRQCRQTWRGDSRASVSAEEYSVRGDPVAKAHEA